MSRTVIWTSTLLLVAGMPALHAQTTSEAIGDDAPLEEALIVAVRENRISKGAIGLTLDVKDTPQSISIVTSEQMEEFGADSLNDALRLATGINVEEWETNRTNYLARGFEIKNTQIDGVGLPNNWGIVTGAMDSFGYEKLEVIRGANGLLTGVGNASGTINYVRKRPTNTPQGSVGVTAGSFDLRRIEADYSMPFTASGTWAGRVVVAAEDKNSWVRGLSNDRQFFYGVIDGQLGEKSTLTAGYSYQAANTKGNMWGALVLANSDGSQAEFDRSVSTTQDWTRWDTRHKTAFVEYTYLLPKDWNLKLSYNYRTSSEEDKLFFVYTYTGIDKDTGLGLYGWPGNWPGETRAHIADLNLNGKVHLFDREHELIVGTDYSNGDDIQYWRPASTTEPAYGELPSFPYAGDAIPEPVWGAKELYSDTHQTLKRVYGAARLSLTDALKGVVGFNWADFHRYGQSTGTSFDNVERKFSPYAGLTYDLGTHVLAYASYSDIYAMQDYTDINDKYLDPTQGVNYEVGVKADWLDKRLLTTLAWFAAEQKGLGTYAGLNANGNYYYEGVDIDSKGVELEVTGRINDYLDVVLGFTSLQLHGEDGQNIYKWVPRKTVNLSLTAKLPMKPEISLGLNGRWQSDTSTVEEYTGVTIRQDGYATLNAFVGWEIIKALKLNINVNNLSDEKHITSLYQVGYYSAPRNYSASLKYSF